jgi:hypothetical protein
MRLALYLVAVSIALGADHPDLTGVWKASDSAETISIHQKQDTVEIAESGKETSAIQCNTVGQACKIKGGAVSLWYNGETLVIVESLHGNSRVTKKKMKMSEDGKSLEVEIVSITPPGVTQRLSLARQSHS